MREGLRAGRGCFFSGSFIISDISHYITCNTSCQFFFIFCIHTTLLRTTHCPWYFLTLGWFLIKSLTSFSLNPSPLFFLRISSLNLLKSDWVTGWATVWDSFNFFPLAGNWNLCWVEITEEDISATWCIFLVDFLKPKLCFFTLSRKNVEKLSQL